jgi:hypothetical protein
LKQLSATQKHILWLQKRGLLPSQIRAKKKALGPDENWHQIRVTAQHNKRVLTQDKIPENGTKSPNMDKANFSNKNYIIAPAFTKGAYQVVPKKDVKYIGKNEG